MNNVISRPKPERPVAEQHRCRTPCRLAGEGAGPLVALTLAASVAVALAQSQTATQASAAAETSAKTSPERPAPGAASAAAGAATQTAPRNPAHPIVKDARLTASPRARYIGPPGTSSPFGSTDMTENQCRDMERCQVVQGQGPSYATWRRCGKGKLTTFTYIHD